MGPDGVVTDSSLEKKPEEKESLPIATRAIRLDGDIDRALEAIAKQENQSVSLIMNKALLRHVDWEYPAGRFGLITVSSSVMRKLFELLTHTIIIKHDRGSATSAYYAEALKTLLDRLNLKAETVESDQQVTIIVRS